MGGHRINTDCLVRQKLVMDVLESLRTANLKEMMKEIENMDTSRAYSNYEISSTFRLLVQKG